MIPSKTTGKWSGINGKTAGLQETLRKSSKWQKWKKENGLVLISYLLCINVACCFACFDSSKQTLYSSSRCFLSNIHTLMVASESNLEFSILSKETLPCRLELQPPWKQVIYWESEKLIGNRCGKLTGTNKKRITNYCWKRKNRKQAHDCNWHFCDL